MPNPLSLLLFSLAVSGCLRDETVTGYATGVWQLQQAQAPRITLDLTARGRISGQGQCNSYSAAQTAPYPWFEPGPIASTRTACPDLAGEQAYLAALSRMQFAEVAGPVLILSNDAGEVLEFRRITPG